MGIRVQKNQNKSVLEEDQSDGHDILSELRPVLVILKAAGLFPIFTQSSTYQIEPPSKQKEFYSFFIRGVFHALTIFILYFTLERNSLLLFWMTRGTDSINLYIQILISMSTYTGSVILCARYSRQFLSILNSTLRIDAEICQTYRARVRNRCKLTQKVVILVVVWQLLLFGVIVSGGQLTSPMQYVCVAIFALQNCLCSLIILLFAAFLRLLAVRFDFVNMILENYNYDMGGLNHKGVAVYSFVEDMSFAFRIHNNLLKLYKGINESCSLLVALFMVYVFYNITANTYGIFMDICMTREHSLNTVLYFSMLLGLDLTLLCVLTHACGEATFKANATSQILARVYGKRKDYQNIIDKFLTKSVRQKVQFTAYGFFAVDNSTLFKMFSAVTTYLVILIQFKQLEDTRLDDEPIPNSN